MGDVIGASERCCKRDHIYMDCMGFGMGCSCLQMTFQVGGAEGGAVVWWGFSGGVGVEAAGGAASGCRGQPAAGGPGLLLPPDDISGCVCVCVCVCMCV